MRPILLALLVPALGSSHAADAIHPPHKVVISGRVTNDLGQPVHQANVFVAELSVSIGTGTDGRYQMTLVAGRELLPPEITLRVRAFGFAPATRALKLDADSIVADFTLLQEPSRLNEVVITGVSGDRLNLPFTVTGVSAREMPAGGGGVLLRDGRHDTDEFNRIDEVGFASPLVRPFSTFAADVDRASYGIVRRSIREGRLPPRDAVRVEELVNYFPYEYASPDRNHPVAVHTAITPAPWNANHHIVRVALQTERLDLRSLPPSNLVFLIDVSGSMDSPDRLPLAREALRLLVEQLREEDRVAIVVYASAVGLVLPSTSGADKRRIVEAIDNLRAGGSTAGGAGIHLAYSVARDNFVPGANNRVILATDGDFNVGISSTSELLRFVEERRKEGIALTVLGFGMGNLKDGRLEQLADRGDGNYAYIDNLLEARKVLVREVGATLATVARDVKIQVEFNPSRVQAYRLIGYENRALRDEDFEDDSKDAGDMGAGHSVTALYEVVLAGAPLDVRLPAAPRRRYSSTPRVLRGPGAEIGTVSVRYQLPAGGPSRLIAQPMRASAAEPDDDFRFALAVAGFGLLIRESPYRGDIDYARIATLASSALGSDPDGYRREFVAMVEATGRVEIAQR